MSQTLENLMAAFNGESNANAKYLEYAKKADADGYAGVASLFRAAAAAEEIHFKNHAEVIKQLGGTPQADIVLPEIKSTSENLKDAIKGETYERDVMYPDFIKEAKAAGGQGSAIKTFRFALEAEAMHAQFYTEALNSLEEWKTPKTYYVCKVCGYTVDEITFARCPVCAADKADFFPVK